MTMSYLALLAVIGLGTVSQGPMREPVDPLAQQLGAPTIVEEREVSTNLLAKGIFFIYQEGVGPTKGSRCAMTPSCSEYGRLAYKRYGILKGTLETFDRLHRCGHDLHYYPIRATEYGNAREDSPFSH